MIRVRAIFGISKTHGKVYKRLLNVPQRVVQRVPTTLYGIIVMMTASVVQMELVPLKHGLVATSLQLPKPVVQV
jgi:hypothetical protein